MAEYRPKVPAKVRRKLIEEAGNKCANPGCPNHTVELHHLKRWAIYGVHDADHMIAVCGACHGAIHNKQLAIPDEKVYEWKGIARPNPQPAAALFVEPGPDARLRCGPFDMIPVDGKHLVVLEISELCRLEIDIDDGDALRVNLRMVGANGDPKLRVVNNLVRAHEDKAIQFHHPIAGNISVTAPNDTDYMPGWVREAMHEHTPSFALDPRVVLLRLEVLKPGLIYLEGIWVTASSAIVVRPDTITFLRRLPSGEVEQSAKGVFGNGSPPRFYIDGPINGDFLRETAPVA